jgi:hypothetical protein
MSKTTVSIGLGQFSTGVIACLQQLSPVSLSLAARRSRVPNGEQLVHFAAALSRVHNRT